jgi:RNA polymerase sigma-54 factor
MRLDQRQVQGMHQRQELRLTQQLIQKLELLQLPAMELQELVQQELQENPVLEVREDAPEAAAATNGTQADAASPASTEAEKSKDAAEQEKLDYMDDLEDEWAGLNRGRSSRGMSEEQSEKYLDMIQNIEADGLTLVDHLMSQISLMELPDDTTRIVEVIAGLLDEDGYLRRMVKDESGRWTGFEAIPDEEIAEVLAREEPFQSWPREQILERVRSTVENVVHKLEPRGIGARTVNECLLLQLPEEVPFLEIKKLLIEKYLDDIAQNKLPKLARELLKEPLFAETFEFNVHSDKDEIIDTLQTLIQDINKLNPKPARDFRSRRATNVTPEIAIKEVAPGEFDAFVNDGWVPEVYVNEAYKKILRDPNASREQKDYIRKKLGAARALVEAIMHRRILLEKVSRRVVEHQRDFFAGSVENLKPLKMKTLANEFGVHISTISRAVNGKYVECPQGIFPLKFFFATAASRSNQGISIFDPVSGGGEKRAKVTILDKLSEIVASEEKGRPLSDEELAKRLKTDGVHVSRRAITKYRKELKIPSSKVRKQY